MDWSYQKKFFKYFIDDKKAFTKYFFLSIIVGILELLGVAITYPFVVKLVSDNEVNPKIFILALLIIFAFLLKNIFMVFYISLQAEFVKNCEISIDKKFMKYFIYGDYLKISQIPFARKLQLPNFVIIHSINNYLLRVLNLCVNIFVFILITAFLFYKFFLASLITVILAVSVLTIQSLILKNKTTKASKLITKANELSTQSANELILNSKTIKLFGKEKLFFNRYVETLTDTKECSRELFFLNTIPPYIAEPMLIILLAVLLGIISVQNLDNTSILVASYAVVISAVFRLAPIINRIQVNILGIISALPQVKDLVSTYEDLELSSFEHVESLENEVNFNKSLELRNVDFSYSKSLILENINLKINKGDFVGITGTSGVGKTTLVDIIAGLLKIKQGSFILDGEDIKALPRLKIGYIPQDYGLFSGSIKENVAFSFDANEIDEHRVVESLKKAQLYDYIIENFQDGIEAKPFVDSTGFSQGQKQRLAIARALYANADILILDEATSALDLVSENKICEVLNSLKGTTTIITIAHRLSTIKSADKVIYMANSTIQDVGTFEELFTRNKGFAELVKLNNSDLIH